MTRPLDLVFAALADPTRRGVVEALLTEGSTSVPALSRQLPISRQAIAKHLSILDGAGLVERAPGGGGREVRYRLREGALRPAANWLAEADRAWDRRLRALKRSVESRPAR